MVGRYIVSKVIRIGTVGDIINTLIKQFENNNVAEICVTFKGKDGSNYSTWSNNENFYQRLGMAESLKQEMFLSVNE